MWNIKNKTNEYNKSNFNIILNIIFNITEATVIDTENKIAVTGLERFVGRGKIGEGELRGTHY